MWLSFLLLASSLIMMMLFLFLFFFFVGSEVANAIGEAMIVKQQLRGGQLNNSRGQIEAAIISSFLRSGNCFSAWNSVVFSRVRFLHDKGAHIT